MCHRALADPDHQYALFIDEINRGNIASIFGELITLLDEDKRLGATYRIPVRLPYSGDPFGGPNNLYVIGTMNTADRSIEALDAALRRRFHFIEYTPDPTLLEREQRPDLPVDLVKMLIAINQRLECLLDRDHCIGHSYFMNLGTNGSSLDPLRQAFEHKVLPLLREYFYGDPGKIALGLGKDFVAKKPDRVRFAGGEAAPEGEEERETYEFTKIGTLGVEAFQRIYA
jgi:5-methylcytosine-specific restriction endonuclease McrBC GTP-binding regulatory subunit McrB